MPYPWEKEFYTSGKGTDLWDIASGGLTTEGSKRNIRRAGTGLREGLAELPIIGDVFGESGSERRMREAEEAMQRGIEGAKGEIRPLYGEAIDAYSPYVGLAGALPGLQQRARAGEFSPEYGQFQAQAMEGHFTPQMERFNFQADPGYKFSLQEGLQAGERGLASMGLTGSGRAAKELARFSTGLAGQQYGQAFNRDLQRQQLGAQLGQQRYGQQLGVAQFGAGLGQQRYAQEAGLGQMGLGVLGQQQQARMGLAGLLSDLTIGGAQARADRLTAEAAQRQQGIGGLMQLGGTLGAAALPSLLAASDIRLKTNIKPTGRKANGFNLYEFEYNAAPGRKFEGVMAQEIEKTRPDAVSTQNGYKFVDYNALGVELKEVDNGNL